MIFYWLTIFNKINFNIEFESTEIDKANLNITNEKNSVLNEGDEENEKPSFTFYCSNNNIEENNNNNNYIIKSIFNKELEIINRKKFDKDSFSEVYEIIKEIIVPES